jgi:hypothetical protein
VGDSLSDDTSDRSKTNSASDKSESNGANDKDPREIVRGPREIV